jgi:hypothetical protein
MRAIHAGKWQDAGRAWRGRDGDIAEILSKLSADELGRADSDYKRRIAWLH